MFFDAQIFTQYAFTFDLRILIKRLKASITSQKSYCNKGYSKADNMHNIVDVYQRLPPKRRGYVITIEAENILEYNLLASSLCKMLSRLANEVTLEEKTGCWIKEIIVNMRGKSVQKIIWRFVNISVHRIRNNFLSKFKAKASLEFILG